MADECLVTLDRRRAGRYFIILTSACLAGSWALWFVLGFMGSHASPDGVTLGDLVRTTMYSLPIGILLASVFPGLLWFERRKKWMVTSAGITVYLSGEVVTSVAWSDLEDVIFREYSIGIIIRGQVPGEHNITLPSENMCQMVSDMYNRSKGTFCAMDAR